MISSSPERNQFHIKCILDRVAKGEVDANEAELEIKFYQDWQDQARGLEAEAAWKENNMEYDLRSCDWILEKVRGDAIYAQHLYAAICNNNFQKNEVWPTLKNQTWCASWRYAGGIIADMLGHGDYMDWYCSGIRGDAIDEAELAVLSTEQQLLYKQGLSFVSESVVTEEIRADLLRLGWLVMQERIDDSI